MTSIGFAQFCSPGQHIAGEELMKNVREFYPDSYYIALGDAGDDRLDACKKYNVEYYQSQRKLGYPQEPYGYDMEIVLEFWERMYIACFRANTTHLVYLEDDIKILKPITCPDVDVYGFDTSFANGERFPNGFTDEFMNMIEEYSGVRPNINGYGAQGGTIIKVKTFLDNYFHVKRWVEQNFNYVRNNIYEKTGWQDSFNTYFFLLSGKAFVKNPNIVNVFDPEGTNEYDYYSHYDYPTTFAISKGIPEHVEIIHNYKKFYSKNQ
jgi:hypothetical protein